MERFKLIVVEHHEFENIVESSIIFHVVFVRSRTKRKKNKHTQGYFLGKQQKFV